MTITSNRNISMRPDLFFIGEGSTSAEGMLHAREKYF